MAHRREAPLVRARARVRAIRSTYAIACRAARRSFEYSEAALKLKSRKLVRRSDLSEPARSLARRIGLEPNGRTVRR